MGAPRILVVRLGSMGDITHTLPAVASLKRSFPGSRLTWIVEPQWAPLLEANPCVDRVLLLRRNSPRTLLQSWRELSAESYDIAIDFQGLIKSALVSAAARPGRIVGFHPSQVRERLAALFYSRRTLSPAAHVVERNLDLAASAGAGQLTLEFPLPPGRPEGDLPEGEFVLASPLAGWRAKQWPAAHYAALGARLQRESGITLVLNGPPASGLPSCTGLAGLIYASRRAAAVVGVDSGPLHLAAALGKPGVAIFGPTDPDRNGPCGGSIKVLRAPRAATTYHRASEIDPSMHSVSPDEVFETLRQVLAGCVHR